MHMVDQLHTGELALPDFQRSFVWAPDATRELIVSIIRGFPAGNLLFLQGGSAQFKARTAEAGARVAYPAVASRSSTGSSGSRRSTRRSSAWASLASSSTSEL